MIYTTESKGYQGFNALLVTFTRRLSHGLSLQAGYQHQNVHGVSYLSNFSAFGATTSPADPKNPSFDQGPGDLSQPDRFTLTGVWDVHTPVQGRLSNVVNGWMLSTRTIAQSGLPFSPQTGQDNNGDTVVNDRPVGIGYNSYRLPSYVEVDVRLTRNFRIRERNNVEIIGEVFNLANRLNPTSVNTTWGTGTTPNTTFNTVTAAETARQFQLGVRYSF